jgi:hypothetical protein
MVAKTDFCPRLMVWQHLIPIIDKEKFFGAGTKPHPKGNLGWKVKQNRSLKEK